MNNINKADVKQEGVATGAVASEILQVPPKKKKVWLAVLVGALIVAAFFLLIIVFAISGIRKAQDSLDVLEDQGSEILLEDGWRSFETTSFSVEFPAEILSATETFGDGVESITLETHQTASTAGSAFTITILETEQYDGDLGQNLRTAVDAGASAGGGTLIEESYDPAQNGVASAYYKVRFIEEGAMQEAKLFATETGFFQVIVVYETGAEPQENIDRFLESFELK